MLGMIKELQKKKEKGKKKGQKKPQNPTRTFCVAFRLFITGLQAWPR